MTLMLTARQRSNRLVGLGVKQRATTHLVHVELDASTLECKYRREHTFEDLFYIHDIAITRNTLVVTPTPMELNLKALPAVLMGFRTFVSALTSRSKRLATAQTDLHTVASQSVAKMSYALLRAIARVSRPGLIMVITGMMRKSRQLHWSRSSKPAVNSIIVLPRPELDSGAPPLSMERRKKRGEGGKQGRGKGKEKEGGALRKALSSGPLRIPITNAEFGSAFHHVQAFEHADGQGQQGPSAHGRTLLL